MKTESFPDSLERAPRSMTEQETLAFLREKGIKPLSHWREGQPVIYVFPEGIRGENKIGAFKEFPAHERPNLVRINSSTSFDPPIKEGLALPSHFPYTLNNPRGGQIDYFAINSETGEITCVKTSANNKVYSARKMNLFVGDDKLFPKS